MRCSRWFVRETCLCCSRILWAEASVVTGCASGESLGLEPLPGLGGAQVKRGVELCYFASSVADWEDIWKMLTALGTFSNRLFKVVIFPRW